MITDDERRRAAARLREVQSDVIPGTKTEVHPIAGRIIGVACGYDLPDFQGLLGRLADLIEPDTTSDTTKSAEDTTKTPTSSDTAPTSSDASATHTDATATCDTSQGRRDTVACDPTGRGVDSIYEWCRGRLEGADGAEDYLYCTIMRAIEDYRHPERATAHTVRAVDREALLALADDMRRHVAMDEQSRCRRWVSPEEAVAYADRIREALGVES